MGLNKLKILEKPSSPTQPSLRRLVDRVKLSSTASKNSDHVAEKRCGADAQHDGSECDHDENCEPVLRAPQRLPSAAAPPKGGLLFDTPADRALAERQRESVRFIACRFGSHLLSRSSAPVSLTSTVMPVHLNEPRSFLQRLTDDLVYADYFLSAAAACKNDPKQRLSLIAGFLVSSLHCSANMAKCFNPHIGETYQATYGSESCPSKVYLEQTRHHPPVSHFVALPADNAYTFSGYASFDSQIRFSETSLYTRRTGISVVHFHDDDSRVVFIQPQQIVRGLLGNERRLEVLGPCCLYYEKYRLVLDILFDPPQPFMLFGNKIPSDRLRGVLYRVEDDSHIGFSEAFANREAHYFGDPDTIAVAPQASEANDSDVRAPIELRPDKDIQQSVVSAWNELTNESKRYKTSEASSDLAGLKRTVLAYATGSFVSHLDIGGVRYWDIHTPKGDVRAIPLKCALPSDSRHRRDIQALHSAVSEISATTADNVKPSELLDSAQNVKEELENQIREESSMRPLQEEYDDGFFPKCLTGISLK